MEHGREFDEVSRLELAQQIATGNFAEMAVGLAPIPELAKPTGDVSATARSLLKDEVANPLEIFGLNSPPPDDKFMCHGVIVAKGTRRRQNYFRKNCGELSGSPPAKP